MAISEQELLARASKISGQTFNEIAERARVAIPHDSSRAKGWVGELLEYVLGATAGNRAVPDFETLGIELKTLPLDAKLTPKESTFVCSAPLGRRLVGAFEESTLMKKLSKVLWVPFEADPDIDIAVRRLGVPFLWQPNQEDLTHLKADWEEHMETIALGHIGEIDGRRGKYLQLRPKAFSSHNRTRTVDADGQRLMSNPRGFYLRTSFTKKILNQSTT